MIGTAAMIGLALTLAPLPDSALPDAALLERAASAFRQGTELRSNPGLARTHFARAAAAYEHLRERGFQCAALFANQGKAYFLAGDLPQAILAFRRGLQFAPGDRGLRADLALARSQVDHPLAATGDALPWMPRPGPRWLWAGLLAAYALAWLSWTRWWMVRRSGLLKWGAGSTLGVLLLAAGAAWMEVERRQDLAHPLVVIAGDRVALRRGNGYRYPPVDDTPLSRGVEARRLLRRGDWFQIELANGQVGWVPVRDALLDQPGGQTSRRAKYPNPRSATVTAPSADHPMSRPNIWKS